MSLKSTSKIVIDSAKDVIIKSYGATIVFGLLAIGVTPIIALTTKAIVTVWKLCYNLF